MKVVLDTNVLMAALLKDSTVRKVLSSRNIDFFLPEFSLKEIEKYKKYLSEKSELTQEEIEELLELILENIEIVPQSKITLHLKEAEKIMENIDIHDTVFIATALAIPNSGIWSFDEDLKKQNKIKIWKIKELLNCL